MLASVVLLKRLLQGFDGLFDGTASLARWSFLRLGANEAIGENGLDQRKDQLALRLSSHDPASGLGLAAPLPVSMRVRRVDQVHDVFPGRASSLLHELVEMRPQQRERLIDHGAGSIQQTQGIGLFLWGAVATTVPLIIGMYLGKYVFRFHDALLLGICSGARTTTASLGLVCDRAQSQVPALGYTVTYAVGNTLLTIWGMVIIMLLS